MSDTIKRYPSHLPFPFSRAIRVGDFLFLSGQVPMNPQGEVVRGDISVQTEAVMTRISETLAECGVGFDQVVKATVWLSDMQHFTGFNEVYKRHFPNGFPVRSTVGAQLALGVDVEVEVQAWLGAS
ncbi:RidA family protein [Pseudomonas helleri]|jgi:2-iminobutanoate/2-iminopropanoate deaminase|uniref:RidA family protein n=1 Tax=Pseudomonas helleri TaxID=1608996 RepID=A0A6A7Z9J9_9PSED|nr:RidA family protein [Pseudomonas helleri]KMN23790.1 endoribonuclease L-PSP [Pseudomonas helleri]MQT35463.1 RidA family protein [Pseudomonas helleri]MQT76603.1 RidA family protein [Pseudomonas helleri]MQT96713.1 RidA family protein [Pseudomonas helleri]MQU06208.1 RidA family protein [Pseudomonas helleri]